MAHSECAILDMPLYIKIETHEYLRRLCQGDTTCITVNLPDVLGRVLLILKISENLHQNKVNPVFYDHDSLSGQVK